MEKEKKTAVERIRQAIESLDWEIEFTQGRLRRDTERLSRRAQGATKALPLVLKGETTHKSAFVFHLCATAKDLEETYQKLEGLRDLKKSMENLLQDES